MTTVLLWSDAPDRDVHDRDLLDGLPAGRVVAPRDWVGPLAREVLLRSFAEARGEGLGEGVLVVGVGRGATAAASLLLHQRRLGLRLEHVVCVDTSWGAVDPISERALPKPGPVVPPTRVDLVGDDPASLDRAQEWARLDWDAHHHPAGTRVASLVLRP